MKLLLPALGKIGTPGTKELLIYPFLFMSLTSSSRNTANSV